MAVQGKLVPQDPNDEPACVLLEHIRKEKEKLIKEGKIKKEKNSSYIFRGEDNLPYEKIGKNEPVCIADEVPFEIPDSWEWCRLISVCEEIGDIDHNMPKASSDNTGIPFLSAKDILDDNSLNFTNNVKHISREDYVRLGRKMTPRMNDIVFSRIGSLGKVGVVRDNTEFLISYSCCIIRSLHINLEYLKYYLMSPIIQAHIIDAKTGIGVPDLGMGEIKKCYIPIPPLNEQLRIVAQLDKAIPWLNRYDYKESSLETLNKSFPELLRKSILQQAVMGKLIPQDTNDEPASDLLPFLNIDAKIQPDEPPFDLPDSWLWMPIGNLGASIGTDSFSDGPFGSNLKTEHYINKPEVRIIQLSNIGKNGWKNENVKYTSYKHLEEVIPRCEVHPGDFVIAKMMPAGRTIEVPDLGTRIALGSDAMRFVPNSVLDKKYLLFAMSSQVFLDQVYSNAHGITRVRTTLKGIKTYLLPIPPLKEQHRIVAALEALLPCCDKLC